MSHVSEQTSEAGEAQEFVVFRLDDEYFAFSVTEVAEVFPYSEPVRMPRAPKFLVGLIDVRGVMLPVVDLRLRAELKRDARPRHILAVRLNERFLGAAVDEVCEVYAAGENAVGDIASLADHIDPQYVRRALRWGKRIVPVMDAAKLLTTDETLRLKRLRSPRRRRGEKERRQKAEDS
jgi:purine-binding chemotaxis protein CheW